jgi:hypothetical protein
MRTEKTITVKELGRLGGPARARKYSKCQIRRWGKLGGLAAEEQMRQEEPRWKRLKKSRLKIRFRRPSTG